MTTAQAEDLKNTVSGSGRFIVALAGPNGAGKTTFYDIYLDKYLAQLGIRFINADLIAQDRVLTGYDAAIAAEQTRRELFEDGVSFCMETVLSDPRGDKIEFFKLAQDHGYAIILIYIGLETQELCIARVNQRVDNGGHDVPDEKIAARFNRSLKNLAKAAAFVDILFLYDNSSYDEPYRCLAKFERGRLAWRTEYVPNWANKVCSP